MQTPPHLHTPLFPEGLLRPQLQKDESPNTNTEFTAGQLDPGCKVRKSAEDKNAGLSLLFLKNTTPQLLLDQTFLLFSSTGSEQQSQKKWECF